MLREKPHVRSLHLPPLRGGCRRKDRASVAHLRGGVNWLFRGTGVQFEETKDERLEHEPARISLGQGIDLLVPVRHQH